MYGIYITFLSHYKLYLCPWWSGIPLWLYVICYIYILLIERRRQLSSRTFHLCFCFLKLNYINSIFAFKYKRVIYCKLLRCCQLSFAQITVLTIVFWRFDCCNQLQYAGNSHLTFFSNSGAFIINSLVTYMCMVKAGTVFLQQKCDIYVFIMSLLSPLGQPLWLFPYLYSSHCWSLVSLL